MFVSLNQIQIITRKYAEILPNSAFSISKSYDGGCDYYGWEES